MEKYTTIEGIKHDDCFNIGNLIVNKAKEINATVAIQIYVDDFMIYQYFMDGRDSNNLHWLEGKRQTVLKTGFSSAYIMEMNELHHSYDELKRDRTLKLFGGGYPLYINNKMSVIICVSGMADSLDDHKLIIESINEYFN